MKKFQITYSDKHNFEVYADDYTSTGNTISFILNGAVFMNIILSHINNLKELKEENIPFLGDKTNPNYKAK